MSDLLIPNLEEDLRSRLERLANRNGVGIAEQAHGLLRDAVFARVPADDKNDDKQTLAEAIAEWRKTLPEDWEGFPIPEAEGASEKLCSAAWRGRRTARRGCYPVISVLDTNVVSELMERNPHPKVAQWTATLHVDDIAITSLTVLEVRNGYLSRPAGRRRNELKSAFDHFCATSVGEYLAYDEFAAEETAQFLATRRRMGRPLVISVDPMIAGIVLRLNNRDGRPARVVTRNVKDFHGVPLVNPWDDPPPTA